MFDFLVTNKDGIILALFVLFILMIFIQWFCWMAGIGRFKIAYKRDTSSALRYVFAEMLVKIINDFRHLLALILVLIFAASLAYAMINTDATQGSINDALQSVTSTLGGLLGAIIGYYFGESAAKQKAEDKPSSTAKDDQEQNINDSAGDIIQAPSPKSK